METISLILSVLMTGIRLLGEGAMNEVGAKGFNAIIRRLKTLFKGNEPAEVALDQFQTDPEVWKKPIAKALEEIGVAEDKKLLRLVQNFSKEANINMEVEIEGPVAVGKYAKAIQVMGDSFNFNGPVYQGSKPKTDQEALIIYLESVLSQRL